MSEAAPSRPSPAMAQGRFAIVASRFNAAYVKGLIEHATAELYALWPTAEIALQQVPGAFEIPIVIRELASQKRAEAIIGIAVIIQGETAHAEHLARSVTDALQQVALAHGVPVINAVLSVENATQARERCLEERINRGTEAARAAVEIVSVLRDLRSK